MNLLIVINQRKYVVTTWYQYNQKEREKKKERKKEIDITHAPRHSFETSHKIPYNKAEIMTGIVSICIQYYVVFLLSSSCCFGLLIPKESKKPEIPSLFYQESTTTEQFTHDDYSFTTEINSPIEVEDNVDNNHASYYTLDPTFDLLVDWTLDFVDAVDLAGGMTRVSVNQQQMFAEDFVFTSPAIGPISKNDFITLMNYYQHNGLDLGSAIPDLTVSYEGWHQDPHDPWRIWAVARYSGTHTGIAILPGSGLTLAPKHPSEQERFTTGPELQSFLWTPSKKLIFHTVGYIGDQHTGSGQGHGSLHGLLVSMGLPPLYLESTESIRNVQNWFSQFRQSENAPRVKSPYSYLPQWWHERKSREKNIQR